MQQRPPVLVGVDGSTASRAALKYALDEAAHRRTGVEVVSAFVAPQHWSGPYGLAGPPAPYEIKSDLRFLARRMVDEVVAEFPALASVPVELLELEGKPAEVLIERARGAALLVVGHRGRGGVAGALLGSVGLACVLHVDCPVTVVRPEPEPAVVGEPGAGAESRERDRVRLIDQAVAPLS